MPHTLMKSQKMGMGGLAFARRGWGLGAEDWGQLMGMAIERFELPYSEAAVDDLRRRLREDTLAG